MVLSWENWGIESNYNMKLKLRIIGNSQGVYIPKEYLGNYKVGDMIEINLPDVITAVKEETDVITPKREHFNTKWCDKHGSYKGTCQCE